MEVEPVGLAPVDADAEAALAEAPVVVDFDDEPVVVAAAVLNYGMC